MSLTISWHVPHLSKALLWRASFAVLDNHLRENLTTLHYSKHVRFDGMFLARNVSTLLLGSIEMRRDNVKYGGKY